MHPMALLSSIVDYADKHLRISEIPDYPGAHNGLQVANSGRVTSIACAVDATLPVIEQAAAAGAGLLIVHHGLFWAGVQAIRGAYYRKLKLCFEADLAVYSAHIPLDVHPKLGNNVLVARALGLTKCEPFLEWKGIPIGLKAKVEMTRSAFADRVRRAVGGGPVHVAPGGPERVQTVGVITGGGGSEVTAVAEEGVDTFVTGEGPHHTFGQAEEAGVNLLYAGHYATETFGVRALADHLGKRFRVPHLFIDHPSGL